MICWKSTNKSLWSGQSERKGENMEILCKSNDKRINAVNYMLEMTIEEYYKLSKDIISNNEFQRRRVKSSSTVYSLLKSDLQTGCIMPPLVLALNKETEEKISFDSLLGLTSHLIILDGLQRTYTIKELVEELQDQDKLKFVMQEKIRIELYVGIDKISILYRMLTLNTGQTQMSTRHQIEIIYSDYINNSIIDGVKFFREIDNDIPRNSGEYKFNDIVEGFTSYIEKNYLTMDRTDILDNIKNLEYLSKEQHNKDLFKDFVEIYYGLYKKFKEIAGEWQITEEFEEYNLETCRKPFFNNLENLFNKSQVMTGFGAAVGKLVEKGCLENITSLIPIINQIKIFNVNNTFISMITDLENIRTRAKKIGNDQRFYFYWLFRYLFDENQEEAYQSLDISVEQAMHKYNQEHD